MTCEDYPCCGHTDGLGCDYKPDMDYIYKHAGCDHDNGYCSLVEVDEDNYCRDCGEFMNYTHGVEGVDFVWHYRLMHTWEGEFAGVRYDVSHWVCVPEGSALAH